MIKMTAIISPDAFILFRSGQKALRLPLLRISARCCNSIRGEQLTKEMPIKLI